IDAPARAARAARFASRPLGRRACAVCVFVSSIGALPDSDRSVWSLTPQAADQFASWTCHEAPFSPRPAHRWAALSALTAESIVEVLQGRGRPRRLEPSRPARCEALRARGPAACLEYCAAAAGR